MANFLDASLFFYERLYFPVANCFFSFIFTEEADERLKPKGNDSYIDFDDDDNGDIPVIPNLEEVQEEVNSLSIEYLSGPL